MKYPIGTRVVFVHNTTGLPLYVRKEKATVIREHALKDACVVKLDSGATWSVYDSDIMPIEDYTSPPPPDHCKDCNSMDIIPTDEMIECAKCGAIFIIESATLIPGGGEAYAN